MPNITELIKDIGAVKKGKFKLTDGALTDYYIDKYVFETDPDVLDAIADAIADRLDESDVDVIAGPELGAVPLVTAVSLRTGIRSAYIRTGEKHHGTQARVEGRIEKGDNVAIVEDVTMTGKTILQTASVVEELGGNVAQMIVVVDRNSEAVENVREAGYELEYLTLVGEDLEITDI